MIFKLAQLLTDARFALRLLRRSPVFGATLLGVLVLGIGATTAMFSIVLSLLVRPLPYEHPEELTMVWCVQPQVNPSPLSPPDFRDWREQGTTFSEMTALESDAYSLSSGGGAGKDAPEYLPGANVSGDFFSMLRIAPAHGRLLGQDDDRFGGPQVVVLSAALWHRRFGSDPTLVGKTIMLNGDVFTVVGIAPEGFRFGGPSSNGVDVWVPLAVARKDWQTAGRGSHFLSAMGRRKPGVTLDQAQAQLSAIAKSIEGRFPDSNTNVGVRLVDLHEELVGPSRQGIWVLFAAVGLVFLVVCANVANLLLARAAARRPEMAARVALGATPARLVAQLVTETVVVFVLASLGGTLLARWLVDLIASGILQGAGAQTIAIRVDTTALGFAIGVALVCGLVFGVVPATEARRIAPHTILKESGARASIGRSARMLRGALVIAQVALAFALLVGGGLTLRAFMKVAATPLGFDPDNLATATNVLPAGRYSDDKLVHFHQSVLERVAAQPGVVSVAGNTSIPMGGSNVIGSFKIEGRAPWAHGSEPLLERNTVTPGYFRTLGIPVLRGRDFTAADREGGRLVLILSKAAADRFFPNENPIGQRIDWGDGDDDDTPHWREIVGVVGDVHRFGRTQPIAAESYAPLAQHPVRWLTIMARTERPEALLREMPAIVASVDAQQAVADRRAMRDRVSGAMGSRRFVTMLLAAFAAFALLLATLGLFGLVSYTTNQRTRELGIRLALGSSPSGVVGIVMRDGLRLLGMGLGVGLVGALVVGRQVAARVSGAAAFDPLVLGVIVAVLALAGILATLLPAMRASRIPPAVALRYE